MAQFTGFQGNILDTTPLRPNTAHGGDNLSISELSTTPQFRWMGETAPATPGSGPGLHDVSTSFQEGSLEKDLQVSFDETLRFEQSALGGGGDVEEAQQTQTVQPTSVTNEGQELDLKYTLRTMNKTVLQLNDFLKACIPKFEVRWQTRLSLVLTRINLMDRECKTPSRLGTVLANNTTRS